MFFWTLMTDTRTISQLEAEGYPWIGCECCKGTVWVPFRMIRQQIPGLSSWTLDQLGARTRCDQCGKRPERYGFGRATVGRGNIWQRLFTGAAAIESWLTSDL